MIPVGAEDAQEIEAALAGLGGRAPVTAADAPLPRLGPVLRQAAARLDNGHGFVLLRGLPLVEDQAEALLLALGAHLGRTVPQGPGGEAVLRVASPAAGVARWRFHADAADIVALLTLRQPPEADPAMLIAAAAVHNEMMKRHRPALETLYGPLPHLLRQGPQAVPRVVDLPVFSTASGAFIGRYARDAIEAAQRLAETPRLTAAQVEALDLLDAICAEPGLALRLDVRPGDVLLFNPLQVWKRRADRPAEGSRADRPAEEGPAETEGTEPDATAREALRLLLVTPTSRALPHGLVALGDGPAPGGGAPGGMVGG
jgi:hypothetical protein